MNNHTIIGGYDIIDIVCDSRQAGDKIAFACLSGAKFDGHDFARAAYDKGSRVFVCERRPDLPGDAHCIVVDDSREAFALLSAEIYGHPARNLTMIGITGTKGKSTIGTLLSETLENLGHKCAFIGTTGIYINGEMRKSANTTPECNILHRTFAEALEKGCTHLVMEVSSQAYKLNRVHGIEYDIAVFTNLTPDHISDIEHANYEEYRDCKAQLFKNAKRSLLNADDEECHYMAHSSKGSVEYYSIDNNSFDGKSVHLVKGISPVDTLGSDFEFDGVSCHVPMPGKVNVSNAAAVLSCCTMLGIDLYDASRALAMATPAKGRFEKIAVDSLKDRSFIIDYAHNGVSLEFVLQTLREYRPRRLVCLFGSIGGRAEMRRRELAEAASKYADFSIITSDNPDGESPEKIIEEIASYMHNDRFAAITDRKEAVVYAVEHSLPGDIILLAGKGHEDYQLIDGKKIHFSEKDIILESASKIASVL